MRLLRTRVARVRMLVLATLALTASSGVAGAAPASSSQTIHLDIGEAADLDAKVVFNVPACKQKTNCFAVHEFFDWVFNGGDGCGEKSAPAPLEVAECSFHVDSGRTLGPFEADAGVFVAPATGLLSCESPETLSARGVEAAESWAEDNGYRCDDDDVSVPTPTGQGYIRLEARSQ